MDSEEKGKLDINGALLTIDQLALVESVVQNDPVTFKRMKGDSTADLNFAVNSFGFTPLLLAAVLPK